VRPNCAGRFDRQQSDLGACTPCDREECKTPVTFTGKGDVFILSLKGLFNTSEAGEWFWRFHPGKRKAFVRARRATARRAIPTLTPLEQRRLLSFTPTWIGQNGSDFVGTVARSPNGYQDVAIHLSGLSNTVSEIYVQRYGGGAWDYKPSSSTSAFFQASSGNPEQGDLYIEPYFNDPTN